jgi:hypothetical protein
VEAHFEGGQGPEGAVAPYMDGWNIVLRENINEDFGSDNVKRKMDSTAVAMCPEGSCFMGMFTANLSQYISLYILYNNQQMHNYFTNFHTTATCFDTIVSSSKCS